MKDVILKPEMANDNEMFFGLMQFCDGKTKFCPFRPEDCVDSIKNEDMNSNGFSLVIPPPHYWDVEPHCYIRLSEVQVDCGPCYFPVKKEWIDEVDSNENKTLGGQCTCKHSFLHSKNGCTCGAVTPHMVKYL